jgi:opacity protein-like surface antigen
MKKLLILILCLYSGYVGFAQDKQSWITIKGGASVPVGNYAGTDLEKSCFTQTGVNFGIEGAWSILKYLGIGGQFGYNLHTVNVSVLGWEKVQADPFLEDLYIRSEPYNSITGMLGVYGSYTFWKKFQVTAKVLGGVMWMKSPYQLYKPQYFLVEPKWYEITSAKDYNFAIAAGLGVQYNLSSCIGLKLEAEYDYSKMVFSFRTGNGVRNDYRNISFINTTLGLVILF